jgi:ABC-type transporter Mla subunit MlaD
LKNTSGSLVDTSNKLVTTSNNVKTITGSLTDTSNILKNVLSLANGIDSTLESAERPETAGTGGIAAKVATINASLVPAEADAHNINTGLVSINGHLTGICTSPVLLILGALTATPC